MPRYAKIIGLLALMIAVAGISNAADEKKDVLIRRVYAVADLPVFKDSNDGPEFDATILLAHIQSTVEPESWMSSGKGEAEMQPFPKNHSIVVSQTQANHEKLVDLLESLRQAAKR
jgi:hypothetical protein